MFAFEFSVDALFWNRADFGSFPFRFPPANMRLAERKFRRPGQLEHFAESQGKSTVWTFVSYIVSWTNISRSDFAAYDYSKCGQIDIADAPNAAIDLFPFLSESIARGIFIPSPVNAARLSFEDFWAEIEKFHQMASHVAKGTQPDLDVRTIQISYININVFCNFNDIYKLYIKLYI